MQVVKFDVQCPPWSLPREEVPIQIKIEKTVTNSVRQVVIDLPASLRLVDTINILEHTASGNQIVVEEIDKARLSEYDYFGIIVATTSPFDDLKKEVPVKMSFFMHDGSVDTVVTAVTVFRPLLEFGDMPDSVTLKDGGAGECDIPIRLKFSGFGDITIRCKCSAGGQIVSRETSPTDEILKYVARDSIMHFDATDPSDHDANDVAMRARPGTEKLGKKDTPDITTQGVPNGEKADPAEDHAQHEFAESKGKGIMWHFYEALSMSITETLSDMLARTLGENLQLVSKTAIVAPNGLPLDELVVVFQYSDMLGNEYDPIQKTIKIVDRRSAKAKADSAIPLTITADESGAYKNVTGMRVGSSD